MLIERWLTQQAAYCRIPYTWPPEEVNSQRQEGAWKFSREWQGVTDDVGLLNGNEAFGEMSTHRVVK
jgi:hypothetical protein